MDLTVNMTSKLANKVDELRKESSGKQRNKWAALVDVLVTAVQEAEGVSISQGSGDDHW